MKLLILFTSFVIALVVAYSPSEQKGYTASERRNLDQLIEKASGPRPVILHYMRETTLLAELYPDYAGEQNPKSLPIDWNYKKGRKQ